MEESLAVARRIMDVINGGSIDDFDRLVAEDYRDSDGEGRDAYREQIIHIRTVFPDLKMTIEEEIVAGEYVVLRLRWNATHRGEFLGRPATGKPIETTAIGILRIVGGRLVQRWNETDLLTVMQQIGAI